MTSCQGQECISSGDTTWVLISTGLVMLMTPGLAFFYGGLVQDKNFLNTLMMNLITLGVVSLQFVVIGYSLSFSWYSSFFGGFSWVMLQGVGFEPETDYAATVPHLAFMIFEMMFAIITPAIISGAVAERITFRAWLIFVVLWTTLVYDPLAHWAWSAGTDESGAMGYGWFRGQGMLDYAGGTVVHMSSGWAALVAAIICGPRQTIDPSEPPEGHNLPLFSLGAGLLWFGWFGFNGGSALAGNQFAVLAVVNTHIAAAASMVTWLILDIIVKSSVTVVGPLSGAVVGLVVITPACGYVHTFGAIAMGAIGGATIFFALFIKCRYMNGKGWLKHFDDSLDVFVCHGLGGTLGAFLTGVFVSKDINPYGNDGLIFGGWQQVPAQLLSIVITVLWSGGWTALILLGLKYTIGLRHPAEVEEVGVDVVEHKQVAYRLYSSAAVAAMPSSHTPPPQRAEEGRFESREKTENDWLLSK